jgi:putative ABC transport system ATP-binding protein
MAGLFDMPEKGVPLVCASQLLRCYKNGGRGIAALSAVSFEIYPNEHIALVGPSGSGKSTLLGLVAGLDRSDGGTIEWPQLVLNGKGRPDGIAVAFQAPSLIPSLTVSENCMLPLVLAGQGASNAKALDALALFGIADLADRLPEQISGGQAQRAALARAVATQPRLLIADEPTGQLDQVTRVRVIEALVGWSRTKGCSLLIASHDRDIAARVDSVWTIHHGKLSYPSRDPGKGAGPDWGNAA